MFLFVRKHLLYDLAQCMRIFVDCTAFAYVFVQISRVKRFVHTYKSFCSFNVSVIRSWGFVDSFNVPMIRSWVLLIHLTFVRLLVMIGPPKGSVRRIRSYGFFGWWSSRSDWTVWRILSSGFRQDIYAMLFKWLTITLFPRNVSCWYCRVIYNPV